ncbi:hypothetical protein TIFTF001_010284 [Ficus carica]|uniref:Cyclic nucleotide-binding domain-containing protein n=1 Tax=Ficus carica TaxID=3494 RepID=A0AA88AIS2_FICCA|nr:hypothetical protein TIFTF001_010284 [Ficus carica]
MSTLPRGNKLLFSNSSKTSRNFDSECYACAHVGVPVFHSTRCDPSHQPQWEASAGSSLRPFHIQSSQNKFPHASSPESSCWTGRGVVDPRSKKVKRWNRVVLLARGVSLAVDPLFFYVVSLSAGGDPCFYVDVALAAAVTVARTGLDALHFGYLWLQFRLAYVSSESMVVGGGNLVWDARDIASHYVRSFKGFWLDAFVVLPIPQLIIWFVVPRLLRQERITLIMTTLLVTFLLQFLPKVYHSIYLMRRLQKVTGYVFGSVWWRFNLNVIAYLIASHVTGACWYILATERFTGCLQQQCDRSRKCNLSVYCTRSDTYSSINKNLAALAVAEKTSRGNMTTVSSKCLDVDGPFKYGIYEPVLLVFSSNSLAVKILYPIFWGLLNLGSFGNVLEPTSNWLELIFSCCITLAGLMLFVTLIGNIQVFLHTVMANKKKMQLQYRDLEWWMGRRQLPSHLRERVRHFQHESWAAMEGQDEMELIQHLPDGLRRDIKRYLCLDLVKKIIREGGPIRRMVFIVRGRARRSQGLSRGFLATSAIEPGGFFGDELLSWCLRRPFVDRLPASSATFTCAEPIEAFAIDADQLRFIIDHFRYKFASERLKRTARYYSSNWRTWGAVIIQLAWRRYLIRTKGIAASPMSGGTPKNRLRQCAAVFLSLRPHDHLE